MSAKAKHVTFRKDSVKSLSPPEEIRKNKYEAIQFLRSVCFCKMLRLCSSSDINNASDPQVL